MDLWGPSSTHTVATPGFRREEHVLLIGRSSSFIAVVLGRCQIPALGPHTKNHVFLNPALGFQNTKNSPRQSLDQSMCLVIVFVCIAFRGCWPIIRLKTYPRFLESNLYLIDRSYSKDADLQFIVSYFRIGSPQKIRFRGYLLITTDNQGNPWVSMDIHGFPCISIIDGYL